MLRLFNNFFFISCSSETDLSLTSAISTLGMLMKSFRGLFEVHMVTIPVKGKKQTNRIAEINSHLTKMLAYIKNLHLLRSGQVTGTGKEKHAHRACSTALPDPLSCPQVSVTWARTHLLPSSPSQWRPLPCSKRDGFKLSFNVGKVDTSPGQVSESGFSHHVLGHRMHSRP